VVKTNGLKVNKETSGSRFLINKDNTVMDRKAGLMIVQDPTLLGESFKKTITFAEATQAIADLNKKGYLGFKDWRLPTVEEICGMVDRTKRDPCYDTNTFKGKFDDWYWSGESCAWNKEAAWCVGSYNGSVYDLGKDYRGYVRPVRSCQCQFAPLPVSRR